MTSTLVKELLKLLKEVHTNSFYIAATKSDVYPHIVFELSEIQKEDAKTILELEVNLMGYGLANNSQIDTYADSVESKLDFFYYNDNKIQFASYYSGRNIVREEDKNIIRRRLTFEIHLHTKTEANDEI